MVDVEIKQTITEYCSLNVTCPIDKSKLKGEFPESINGRISYGNKISSLLVALNTVGAVSTDRVKEIAGSILNLPISKATIISMVSRFSMHNIRYFNIHTSSELIYSDKVDFSSANAIIIKAPLIDVSAIKTALNVTHIGFGASKISGLSTLKDMESLNSLILADADINEENLIDVSKADSVEDLSFLRCNFSISEEQVNEALKGFYERKVEVKFDECVFSEKKLCNYSEPFVYNLSSK